MVYRSSAAPSPTSPPLAPDPTGSPLPPRVASGTAYPAGYALPTSKWRGGAEMIRYTLDVNDDGVVDAFDQSAAVAGEAARLSRCADRFGVFARMRSELLARDPPAFGEVWYKENALPILAGKLGIDSAAFSQCLSSTETRKAVERDSAQARDLGFEEAPSFVAQGIPLSGMQSAESLAGFLRQSASSAPNSGIDTNGGRD